MKILSLFANSEYDKSVLKSQDIVVCLKLAVWPEEEWRFAQLADSLKLSVAETHAAHGRLRSARLLDSTGKRPLRRNLVEMLVHGLKYFVPAEFGPQSTGMPTAYAASPLKELFLEIDAPQPVWPWPQGEVYGYALTPLYRTVPDAAANDPDFYELLVLVDALRLHQARAAKLAEELMTERIKQLAVRWHGESYALT